MYLYALGLIVQPLTITIITCIEKITLNFRKLCFNFELKFFSYRTTLTTNSNSNSLLFQLNTHKEQYVRVQLHNKVRGRVAWLLERLQFKKRWHSSSMYSDIDLIFCFFYHVYTSIIQFLQSDRKFLFLHKYLHWYQNTLFFFIFFFTIWN